MTLWFCCLLASVASLSSWQFSKDGGVFTGVEVPHDWAIAGPFDPTAEGRTGKLPWQADGEYRTTFTLAELPEHARLEFDGVMAWPEVFVNGMKVGGWDYGYLGFVCDATAAVRAGANEVVVKASTRPHQSRWYPGGGIYREVRLVTDRADHLVPGSVSIRATSVTAARAEMTVAWEMSRGGKKSRSFTVVKPRLWDVDDPHLYELDVEGTIFRYGIRTAEFTANDGFHLNGRRVQLKGVNLHADLGPLGMAFDRDAAKRQLLLMRDMGVNAIRTAHNPPDPKFLDLCDEMGFLVWDECFDKWDETAGRKSDQSLEEFVTRNLAAFVRRDRNHPSVICWSIGNEIAPVGSKYGKPSGMTKARTKLFCETVRAEDATRPVTAGCASPDLVSGNVLDDLDLVGWNYERSYLPYRERYPEKPIVYSESASAVSNYGFYKFPVARSKNDFTVADMAADGYDTVSAWCGDIPDIELARVAHDAYLAGEFVWTGIDYLGEPNPFCYIGRPDCWPNAEKAETERPRSSYFGIADLIGVPKDRWYLYRANWNDRAETVHLVPGHWNFGSGTVLPVFVYTSGDEAELFLNGRSLGRRRKASAEGLDLAFAGRNPPPGDWESNAYYRVCSTYRLRWADVPYEPGKLTAVSYRNGQEVGRETLETAGRPVAVRLREDPYTPKGSKFAFVQVDVVDAAGVRVPTAVSRLSFELNGDGKVQAVGNGDPIDFDSFAETTTHRLYYGKALAYVRRGAETSCLTVSGDGLRPAEIVLAGTAEREEPYAFRKELETVHVRGLRDETRLAQADEFAFADGTVVSVPDREGLVFRAAEDFVACLSESYDVSARVAVGEACAALEVKIDPRLPERAYRVEVASARVVVSAHGEREAAQGLYHLEDRMGLVRAPLLKIGTVQRQMRYSPRMIHSGWGIDVFPEAYLKRMAHHGLDAILVFIQEAGRTKHGWDDVNAIIRTAKKWGVDTYLYSYVHAPVHPDDPKATETFRNSYGAIARAYPEAKGFVFVGESCHFPSKDPRTNGTAWPDKPAPGDTRPYPGMFPCSDYPDWLRGVRAAIVRENPSAEVVFWTYNFGRYPVELRLPLLEKMPRDVSLLVTFEMFENSVKRNGMRSRVWDYSISDPGPGGYYLSEAEACGRLGLKLYTQANTAGHTWDLGTVGFLPCPYQWKKRWDALNASHARHGLAGLMEGHHYGWYPSFVTELAKEAFTEGGLPFESHIRQLAVRDFGTANADAVLEAWRLLSDAIADSFPCPQNLAGPYRIGPAMPFNFGGTRIAYEDVPFPKESAYAANYCWTYFNYLEDFAKSRFPPTVKRDWEPDQLRLEVDLLADMIAKAEVSADLFATAAARADRRCAANARAASDQARYMARVWTTTRNLKRGVLLTLAGNDLAAMLALAREEYANKKATLPLVDRRSRLGWEPSMEYFGGRETILWAMRLMETTYGL